jgi:hypothetical protein
MDKIKTNQEIEHITYNTGNVFKFNPLRKVTLKDNRSVFADFKRKASKGVIIGDTLIFNWGIYLISISEINNGIFIILILYGIKTLSVNIFSDNQLITIICPEILGFNNPQDLAQIEQLIACYLFFHPRKDLKYVNPNYNSEDIPNIMKDYYDMYWKVA